MEAQVREIAPKWKRENESERFQRKQDQAHRQRNSLANVMCEQDFFKRRETALDKLTLCDSRE